MFMQNREKRFCFVPQKADNNTNFLDHGNGSYKSFSILTTLESLDWLKNTFKTLIATPKTKRFFLEKRYGNHCIWVRKTTNRNGHIAEVFRVDNIGRKSCILVLEGPEKSGWVSSMSIISPNVEQEPKVRPPVIHPKEFSKSNYFSLRVRVTKKVLCKSFIRGISE